LLTYVQCANVKANPEAIRFHNGILVVVPLCVGEDVRTVLAGGLSDPIWDTERLRVATDAAGVALWSWNVDTDEIALDARAHDLWGVRNDEPVTLEDLSARIHPEDLNRVRVTLKATQAVKGAYEIDFRIQHGDEIRWISARGQGGNKGLVDRVLFAVFLDVTERRRAEEAREMLAGEMSHRIKNLFAIASALTTIAARSTTTTVEMARDLTQRLSALGRAHDLVRPMPGRAEFKAALLGDLLASLLAPYSDTEAGVARVHVSVPEVSVGESAITTLALVVHELATNSLKYGALSVASGAIDLSCAVHHGTIVIVWAERGGPPVTAPRRPEGFGSRLIKHSISGQLGGSIAFDWPMEGVVVTLRISKARLAT